MKKTTLKGLDLDLFTETLDNGLKVFLVPFKDKKGYYADYLTRYGGKDIEFEVDGKMVSTPAGVAHFLEHKLFEQEDGIKPFEFYAKSGTECNASTNSERTRYYIYGSNNREENLEFLIDYVNSPYFTDENVEKEKGIIIEELNMYKAVPERVINNTINEAIFKIHPVRLDVGGTIESVKTITKEDLYMCYNTFYNPSNMILALGGTFDPVEMLDIIKNNKKLNAKTKKNKIKLKEINEDEEVNIKYQEIEVPALTNMKVAFAIKTEIDEKKLHNIKTHRYLSVMLNILFGQSSIFRENLYKDGLLTSMSWGTSFTDNILTIEFNCQTDHPKEIVDKIINHFRNGKITPKDLERQKKIWISSTVFSSDIVYSVISSIVSEYMEFGEIDYNGIDSIRKLNIEELKKVRAVINYDNVAIVVAKTKEETK